MKEKTLGFLKYLLPVSIVLFAVQYVLVNMVLKLDLYYPTWAIYVFHLTATLIIYAVLVWINENFKDKTGFAFMGFGMLKMMAAVVFLLPLILSKAPHTFANLVAFFVPYFLFLLLETIFAVRLINAE